MLQPYTKQEDIPEALREHYSKREDGQWHVDIPDTHPAVKHNAKLLSEKQAAESKVTQLTSDVESARAGNLGRGQVVVTKAEAALLEEYRPLGTPAELKTKVAEHETFKADLAKRQRADSLKSVAGELGYNADAFSRLPDLPDFEIREANGKKSVVAMVKDGDKTVEKPAAEYIEGNFEPFLPALKAQQGVTVHGSSSGGAPPKTVFDKIRSEVAERQEQAKTQIHPMFNKIPGRTKTAQAGE